MVSTQVQIIKEIKFYLLEEEDDAERYAMQLEEQKMQKWQKG